MSKLIHQIEVLQEAAIIYFLVSGTIPRDLIQDLRYLKSKLEA